ncbi:MAG: hypothetical protein JXB10_01190 [Pirellulales bacterium]|nr:hypothetical protein [Pirellulales bacterium]
MRIGWRVVAALAVLLWGMINIAAADEGPATRGETVRSAAEERPAVALASQESPGDNAESDLAPEPSPVTNLRSVPGEGRKSSEGGSPIFSVKKSGQSPNKAGGTPALQIEEERPAVFYLPDEDGRLQAVLDFRYEDFIKLYHLQQQLAGQEELPRYSIPKLTISGSEATEPFVKQPSPPAPLPDHYVVPGEGSRRAELTVKVQLVAHRRDWVRIPLRLNQALLTRPAEYQGEGEAVVHYQPEGDGYVCWLRCPSDKPQELTLSMAVPLTVMGQQTRLRLHVPAATESELKFRTPGVVSFGRVSEGALLLPPVDLPEGEPDPTEGDRPIFSAKKSGQPPKPGKEWTVRGLSGNFEFRWQQGGGKAPDSALVLEAVGNVVVRLDPRRVLSEASLTVRSFGAPCAGFQVRLPPGARLISSSSPAATITPVNDASSPGKSKTSPEGDSPIFSAKKLGQSPGMVEVRLNRPTTQPVEVQLATERIIDPERPPEWIELAGFEVPDAVRQWGTVAAAGPPNVQVYWGALHGARQIDAPPEALRIEGLTAAFEYAAQPYALPVRLAPRRTRIHLEAEYVFFVQPERVELDAKLAFAVRGSKVQSLQLLLPGWEFDGAGPETLVADEAVDCTKSGLLTLPLRQPATGQVELRLRAHRSIAPAAGKIEFLLPQPQSATVGAAVVAIVPADNVELIPDNQSLRGMIRQPSAPPLQLPPRQQEPLFYRSEGRLAAFAAEVRLHARRVETRIVSLIRPQERQTLVEQKFLLQVAYEPLDQVCFEVPEEAATKELEFRQGEKLLTAKVLEAGERASRPQSLTGHNVTPQEGQIEENNLMKIGPHPSPLPEGEGTKSPAGRVRMQVALPEAGIGLVEIQARYRLPPLAPGKEKPRGATVPLILPVDGVLGEHRAVVSPLPGMKIASQNKAWQPEVEGECPDSGEFFGESVTSEGESRIFSAKKLGPSPALVLRAEGRQDELKLAVEREPAAGRGSLVIERGWIQTWLGRDVRQDRAVFQFTGNRKELAMQLPGGAVLSPPLVMLDGKLTAVAFTPQGSAASPPNRGEAANPRGTVPFSLRENGDSPPVSLLIPLADDGQWRRHVLEVQYHFSGPRPPPGTLRLEFPRLEKDTWIRRLYWQLVLPCQEHVLLNPPGFENENRWGFSGWAWFRHALQSQADLENWTGASRAAPLEGVNAFLFSAVGNVPGGEVYTISRAWLVFGASGTALLAALLLIYWPAVRRPLVLLLLASVLAVLGGLNPDPALLVAQTAILGVLLGGAVAVWERIFSRSKPFPAAETVSITVGRSSIRQSVGFSDLSSTQTVPASELPPAAAPPSEEAP